MNGFYLRYVLANTADGRGCVGFAAVRQRDRLDGFIRRPPGERLTGADVPRLLGPIGVRGVIGWAGPAPRPAYRPGDRAPRNRVRIIRHPPGRPTRRPPSR